MSNLIVKVTSIGSIKAHANADRLDIAIVGGWQCVTPKDRYQAGDKIVYMPPDTMLPREWADKFGVTQYLSFSKDNQAMGRIRCAKLRGEPSFGLVVDPYDPSWPIGEDVAAFYGCEKYQPPVRLSAGDSEAPHPLFVEYTEIENLRNYSDVFKPGERVVISEKLHGANGRIGIIDGIKMAGSHKMRRKEPDDYSKNTYWFPWTIDGVRNLLDAMGEEHKQVILYGEVFGKGIQCLDYGQRGLAFRAFDLLVDGKYMDFQPFAETCASFGVPIVPIISQSPFSMDYVRTAASGAAFSGKHIKEGVVIKPEVERTDPRMGRVILKYLSDAYLLKQYDEYADD